VAPETLCHLKKLYKNQINAKIFKTCLIFISIAIKNDDKGEKMDKKIFSYAEFQNMRPALIVNRKSLNLALLKKSLVYSPLSDSLPVQNLSVHKYLSVHCADDEPQATSLY
jgi:hypothetical protein